MDPVTHVLLGAAAAGAVAPDRPRLATRERVLLGMAAALWPDVDFAGFLVDPLRFLADWHQGATHSLLLLPLWATLIASLFVVVTRRRGALPEAVVASGLGVGSHLASDWLTAYGTMLFYPLSSARMSLGTTFVVDPVFTGIAAAALVGSLRSKHRWPLRAGLVLLAAYVAAQVGLRNQALDLARSSAQRWGPAGLQWAALPQPFSPFNWKLIVSDGLVHREAHVNLIGHPPLVPAWPGLHGLHRMAVAFRAPREASWRVRHRLGDDPDLQPTIARLWAEPRFAAFRRFAAFPAVSAVQREGDASCIWFTDLRYDLPAWPDTFRYGFCRERADAPWHLYRLHYLTTSSRQPIE